MSLDHIDTLISFALVMLLLALLVTTLVEAFNVTLLRRGKNLQWAVARILEQLGVASERTGEIARAVLMHPAVSSTGKVRASAIRVDELARLLLDLVHRKEVVLDPGTEAKFRTALTGLETKADEKLGAQRDSELRSIAGAVTELAKAALTATGMNTDFEELESKVSQAIDAQVEAATLRVSESALELRSWFGIVMDRATERYVAQTRWVTVAIAAALCLGFQIDSVQILRRLSTDDELRGAIVSSAGAVQGDTEHALLELDVSKRLASNALEDVRLALEASGSEGERALAAALGDEIPDLRTPLEARDWVSVHVQPEAARAEVLARFGPAMEKRVEDRLKRVRTIGATLLDDLEKTQLDLFGRGRLSLAGYRDATGSVDWKHVWGILGSIALLSLGAPFWFNALRNLSNLRPIVARKIDQAEREVEQKS